MKNKSFILKIITTVAIGLLVGRFVTPLFGAESPWTNIAISTGITITLFVIIESITGIIRTDRTNTVRMSEIKNLHKVKRHEIRQASLVLADAFKEDSLFKRLFGDAVKNSNKYTLVANFMIKYCYKYGSVYASSEKFEGIMAITQNEYAYMNLWRIIRSGSIFPFLSIGFKSSINVSISLSPLDEVRAKHMKNKSFAYLQIIGVAKEHQGKGHGGKLVTELIKMTDKDNIPIYLETETKVNVKFYEKYRFKILEQINLPFINQPMWTMIREIKNKYVLES